MIFNSHSGLSGQHSFLSPSKYHWINYNEEKLEASYIAARAAKRGTDLHDLAHRAITLKINLPRTTKTVDAYVNDGIKYGMTSEQPLYYSDNCFGTPDTISFHRNKLRIHDLKTGISRTSHRQLEVYAAIFCLEYGIDPYDIEMEFRIYQNDEVDVWTGDPDFVAKIMDTIVYFDNLLLQMKGQGL